MTTQPEVRYCGRVFSDSDLQVIRGMAQPSFGFPTRAAIARGVCDVLSWRGLDGRPKEMSARVALLRMPRDGLLDLPEPRHAYRPVCGIRVSAASDPPPRSGQLSRHWDR